MMSKALAKNRTQLLMTNRLLVGWKKNNRLIKSQRSDSKGYKPIEESKTKSTKSLEKIIVIIKL